MELVKIKQLLAAYFEGETSLSEEKQLQDYFNSENVSDELVQYKPLFVSFKVAREEQSTKTLNLPEAKPRVIKTWWYSVAAMLVVAFGVGSFYFSQPSYTPEEQEALMAFEQSKKAMLLLSENLNKGTNKLTFVGEFEESKERIFE